MAEVGNISENVTVTELPFASVLGVQGYTAMVTVLLVLLVPPQLFLSIITIAGLCAGKEFKKVQAQRNIMITIAATGFISSTAVLCFTSASYCFLHNHTQAGVVFCHGGALFSHINFEVRNLLLVTLSVTIYIIIKHSLKQIKVKYLNIALGLMLPYVLIPGVVYVIPPAIDASLQFDGILCRYQFSPGGYVGGVASVFLIDAPARIISVAMVIATILFIRKSEIISKKQIKVSMVKFCTLLLVMNLISWVCGWVGLGPIFPDIDQNVLLFLILYNSFPLNSILGIATPLLMICTFKPLRKSIKNMPSPFCYCWKKVVEATSVASSSNAAKTSVTSEG